LLSGSDCCFLFLDFLLIVLFSLSDLATALCSFELKYDRGVSLGLQRALAYRLRERCGAKLRKV
jgi:hypothetical protein